MIAVENDIRLEFQEKKLQKIRLVVSNSSCFLDDIQSFVYGPFTSRFWLTRKHMNQLKTFDLLNNVPFYAWDCITLQLKNRSDVYFIIRDEATMTRFLKLLIYELKTLDGKRGSAEKFINDSVKEMMSNETNNWSKYECERRVRHQLMESVFVKYNLMRVRQKISFSGLIKKLTMVELWLKQIMCSFTFLVQS